MLFDERGVYGGLHPGHEKDRRKGLSDDELFKQYQREDPLWGGSEQRVHEELGFTSFSGPTDTERLLKKLAKKPSDLSYSSYHRHSQLEGLLKHKQKERRWDPLEGIDRYWVEHKAEARASGDFENKRQRDVAVPKEGHVRIIIAFMDKGHENIGILMGGPIGLTVDRVLDPKAYDAGMRPGDEVLQVNKVPVTTSVEFKQALAQCAQRNRIAASPVIVDVWRQPARSAHHGSPAWASSLVAPPMPGGPMGAMPMPTGSPAAAFGAPAYPAPLTGAAMVADPHMMMRAPPPAPGLQQRLAALAHENALLRERLGEAEAPRRGCMF